VKRGNFLAAAKTMKSRIRKSEKPAVYVGDAPRRRYVLWAMGLGLAAFVIVAVVVSLQQKNVTRANISAAGSPQMASATISPGVQIRNQKTAGSFDDVKEIFEHAKTSPFMDVKRQAIQAAYDFLAKHPDTPDAPSIHLLIMQVHDDFFEERESRQSFVDYAEATGKLEVAKESTGLSPAENIGRARKVAIETIWKHADELNFKRLRPQANDYYNEIVTRYPDSSRAGEARLQIAQNDAVTKKKNEAYIGLDHIIVEGSDAEKIRAFKSLATAKYNRGDADGAIAELQELEQTFPTDDIKGYVAYSIGLYTFSKGKEFYADALVQLNRVLSEFPQHLYVPHSHQMIQRIVDIQSGRIFWPQPKPKPKPKPKGGVSENETQKPK
jgi:tetratricopeptide (TPR) repeat protein